MKKLLAWIGENKIEFALLFLILSTAAFLRLWRIADFMTFLGDEGRDVIVVKNLLTRGDLIFIGPTTSVGNMYLGPLYYYLMAPFLALWRLDPVGPAVMVTLIGIATVFLVYLAGRLFFAKEVGLFASALYAISPIPIIYSRSSWNPNPMPFFALLIVLFLYLMIKSRNYWWLVGIGGSLAFAVQMHYLGVLLIPLVAIIWLAILVKNVKQRLPLKKFFLSTLASILLFSILMSPLLIFDLNPAHRFLNYNAFKKFFLERQATEEHLATINLNPFNALGRFLPRYESFFTRFITAKQEFPGKLATAAATFALAWTAFIAFRQKKANIGLTILGLWLAIGIFGISLYQLEVFDHYFGFINPAAFLFCGLFLWLLYRQNLWLRLASIAIFASLVFLNFQNLPIRGEPNRQLSRTKAIAREIIKSSFGKSYNFALIAQNNYDDAYEYFLDLYGHQATVIDNQHLGETITDQLFVVCEDPICQPLGYPKWEVAGFGKKKGLAEIEKEWDFAGVKLFKLIHNLKLQFLG